MARMTSGLKWDVMTPACFSRVVKHRPTEDAESRPNSQRDWAWLQPLICTIAVITERQQPAVVYCCLSGGNER